MMKQLGTVLALLQLLPCLLTQENTEEISIVKKLPHSIDQYFAQNDGNLVLPDGSFPYVFCDFGLWVNGTNGTCEMHVVKLSTPEVKYSFSYYPSKERGGTYFFCKYGSTAIYCLMKKYFSTLYDGIVDSGIAFDLTSKKESKLALPSHINTSEQYAGAILNSDRLEIIVRNHTVCGDLSQCKLTYDSQGRQQGQPEPFPIDYVAVKDVPKSARSTDEGLFVTGSYFRQYPYKSAWGVAYINASGVPIFEQLFSKTEFEPPVTASNRDLYGFCHRQKSEGVFYCTQYDWRTNETSSAIFNISEMRGEIKYPQVVSIANSDDSSYVLTVLDCKTSNWDGSDESKCKTADSLRVNSRGELLRSVPIFRDMECDDVGSIKSAVVEVEDRFCFYVLCGFFGWDLYIKCLPTSSI